MSCQPRPTLVRLWQRESLEMAMLDALRVVRLLFRRWSDRLPGVLPGLWAQIRSTLILPRPWRLFGPRALYCRLLINCLISG